MQLVEKRLRTGIKASFTTGSIDPVQSKESCSNMPGPGGGGVLEFVTLAVSCTSQVLPDTQTPDGSKPTGKGTTRVAEQFASLDRRKALPVVAGFFRGVQRLGNRFSFEMRYSGAPSVNCTDWWFVIFYKPDIISLPPKKRTVFILGDGKQEEVFLLPHGCGESM